MRCSVLQAGLILALASTSGASAQRVSTTNGSSSGTMTIGGRTGAPVTTHPAPAPFRAPVTNAVPNHAPPTVGRSGHWPSWEYGAGITTESHREPSHNYYPYVYPGLLSFGYGLPVAYGLGVDDDRVEPAPPPPAPVEDASAARAADAPPAAEVAPPLYRPAYAGPEPAAPVLVPVRQQPVTTLIFKDGRPQKQVHNYALTSTTLWALDGETRQEVPLDALDIPATVRANREAGVDFALPSSR